MKDSKITKKLNECVEDTTSSDSEYDADVDNSEVDDALRDTQVRIWVNPIYAYASRLSNEQIKWRRSRKAHTFEIGKSNAIDIPSDARSAKKSLKRSSVTSKKLRAAGIHLFRPTRLRDGSI